MNEEELVYGVGSGYTSGAVNSGARLAQRTTACTALDCRRCSFVGRRRSSATSNDFSEKHRNGCEPAKLMKRRGLETSVEPGTW